MTVSKALPAELIDGLLSGYKKPEDLIGENGLLKQLTKALVERALEAEMEAHLGHARHEAVTNPVGNTRNGKSKKTLKGEFGELPVEIPRDRHGSFEPQLVPKHQTRWSGFDDKIISLYARGMTVREIQGHLEEMYGTDLLATATTGLAATTTLAYKPLTDNTVYTKDTNAVYPVMYLQAPIYVVSSVSTSNGIGGNYTTNYNYAGAKSHLTGGGFLGFREKTTTDVQGIKTIATNRQD